MFRMCLILIPLFCGCGAMEMRIQGSYADTRIFAKDGEVGIAFRPRIAIIQESNQFTR